MGLNHETAPVQVREHFAVNAEQQGARAKEIVALSTIGEAVVVSTCNRMEIYAAVEQADVGIENLRGHLAEGREAGEMDHLYTKEGDDAKRHLFRLVSGLDSMVLGETEIFGQVKQAYQQALESSATKGVLNKLFQVIFGGQAGAHAYADPDGADLGGQCCGGPCGEDFWQAQGE